MLRVKPLDLLRRRGIEMLPGLDVALRRVLLSW